MGIIWPQGARIAEDHTNIGREIIIGKLLFGSNDCSLKIVKFVSSNGLSIEVVFPLKYITSGKLGQELEVFEKSAFFVE